MPILVTKEPLDFYDEYEGDFGQLNERWVPQKDRDRYDQFGSEKATLLGEYVDKLHFVKVDRLSDQLRSDTAKRIAELESVISPEVIIILRNRVSPSPQQVTELQLRPFPFHLWRPVLKLLLLKLTPILIIGYYGQRYLTDGRLPLQGPVEFVVGMWLAIGLMLSLTFSMDWLLMRRFTWALEPEGVHIHEHGATVQVVPWNEISGLKLKPLGLILWSGKKVLRFSYLPSAEAERLLKDMEARIRESGNGG